MPRIKYYNKNTNKWEYADSQYVVGGANGESGVLCVTAQSNSSYEYTADKTAEDVYEAYMSGKSVVCNLHDFDGNYSLPLIVATPRIVIFGCAAYGLMVTLKITDIDNTVEFQVEELITEDARVEIEEWAESLIDEKLTGVVKNVNGIAPDANGNVEITIPDGACVVTITSNDLVTPVEYSADKTSGEIHQAWKDGIPIYCELKDAAFPCVLTPTLVAYHKAIFTLTILIENASYNVVAIIEHSAVTVEMFEGMSNEAVLTEVATYAAEHYQPKGDYVTEEAAEQILGEYVRKDELPDSGGSGSGGSEAFYVTVQLTDYSGFVADKTTDEIYEAYTANKSVHCKFNTIDFNAVLDLSSCIRNVAVFTGVTEGFYYGIQIGATSGVEVFSKKILTEEDASDFAETVDNLIDERLSGAVKSVNGIAPDANGNVKIAIPDSGGNVDYVLPVGGAELGGVKNGGNVVINADGTMTAPEATGGTVSGEPQTYDTQAVGTLFDRPDGWNYVTWCSNALQYDKSIDRYVNLIWARGGHVTSTDPRLDDIYRAIINPKTLCVEDISPIVMLDSDGVTDITTDLMEGASFIILEDGTYIYMSYLDNTSTWMAYKYTSTDHGKTWVKDPDGTGMQCPYKMRELSNGRILFSNTSKGKGIFYSDDKMLTAKQAFVTDGYGLAYGSYVSEWEFVELEENYIMAIGRKNSGGAGSEFSGDSDHALITYSTDNGATWSKIVESQTIDNMNASNATSIVHDGLVEIFTTSRWYYGKQTNSDHDATGKDGAMFHYVATIEDAKNDNFANLGVVLYANGTNNSAQDFHAPCLALNTKTNDALIVYMDRLASNPESENNNYHYVIASLGKVTAKINDGIKSPVFAYSNREVDNQLSKLESELQKNVIAPLYEKILTLEYALSKIEGSGVQPPAEVPDGAILWTTMWNSTDGAFADSAFAGVMQGDVKKDEETTDSLGNAVRKINGKIYIPVTKPNFAIEVVDTYGLYVFSKHIGYTVDEDSNAKWIQASGDAIGLINSAWSWATRFYSRTEDVVTTKRVVKRGDAVTCTLMVNGEIVIEDYDMSEAYAHPSDGVTHPCVFLEAQNALCHSIKFGEWD